MHYVLSIDVKRVEDTRPAPESIKKERGDVVDLGHIVVKNADLAELKRLAGAHLELVSDI
jgi:hypothetical protein